MATNNILSLAIFFILFLISANAGRTLHKELKLNVVSRATAADSYTTNYTDVVGLSIIVSNFPSLQELNEDPCVSPTWTWIECNTDPRPRVIALDLNNRLLYGQLLLDFSSMDALQRIDLSQNFIYGYIPSFLGTIPDLQELNLAYNYFTGSLPNSIACNDKLKLSLTGNSGAVDATCSTSNDSPASPANGGTSGGGGSGGSGDNFSVEVPSTKSTKGKKKKNNIGGILGGSISAFVVFWAAIGGYAVHRHKAKAAAAVSEAQAEAPSTKQPAGATGDTPMEEVPINAHPAHMSPSPS